MISAELCQAAQPTGSKGAVGGVGVGRTMSPSTHLLPHPMSRLLTHSRLTKAPSWWGIGQLYWLFPFVILFIGFCQAIAFLYNFLLWNELASLNEIMLKCLVNPLGLDKPRRPWLRGHNLQCERVAFGVGRPQFLAGVARYKLCDHG